MSTPYKNVKTKPYPESWSLVEVQTEDGRMLSMNVPVAPNIADWLTQQMRDTGFLTLRNDKESIAISASKVVAFKLTLMTTGETK
jgi:hypothetical protein